MKKSLPIAAIALTIALASTLVSAQAITETQARAIIAPLYVNFTQPVKGDAKALLEQGTTDDWQSCSGEEAKECRDRETSLKVFAGFGKAIPDMKHEIKELIVVSNKIIVRGEITGTPAGDFFGVAHTGKNFKIMAIDIQTINGGKIAHTYHVEDWAAALGQLRAK